MTGDRVIMCLVALLCGVYLGWNAHPQPVPVSVEQEGRWLYPVTRLSDGDSFVVNAGALPTSVRLFGVDAPEQGQAYGAEAKRALAEMIDGKRIAIRMVDRDRYGRVVAIVETEDGRNVNQELVRQGAAWHFTKYDDSPELARLQQQAQSERRGLWAQPNPEPPWDYRNPQSARRD